MWHIQVSRKWTKKDEKPAILDREFGSETPTKAFENEINGWEEVTNDDQHDAPCENCQNLFNSFSFGKANFFSQKMNIKT